MLLPSQTLTSPCANRQTLLLLHQKQQRFLPADTQPWIQKSLGFCVFWHKNQRHTLGLCSLWASVPECFMSRQSWCFRQLRNHVRTCPSLFDLSNAWWLLGWPVPDVVALCRGREWYNPDLEGVRTGFPQGHDRAQTLRASSVSAPGMGPPADGPAWVSRNESSPGCLERSVEPGGGTEPVGGHR